MSAVGYIGSRQRGFTLLEVLVAVAVFVIVGTLAMAGYNELVKQSGMVDSSAQRTRAVQDAVRRLSQDTEVGGRLLPAGVAVAPCIHLVHRRPDVYPEPARFRPERFLEQPAGTYTWIPFGGGVRRCLGASFALFEMKQVLTAMMSRIEPSSSATSERVIRRAITMSPSRGGEVTLAA